VTCLDDDTVLGLVEGRLAAGTLADIDVHLDTCASCRDVVSQLARTREDVLVRGRAVGRYVIGDLLGSGAMGRVYSAWEPDLDRRVAIKIVRDAARGRALREAQAMARLNHPNVVTVHEVGTTEDGVFVAMELVDGETLRVWAEQRRTWREAAGVLLEVARGLAAVHAAGVIHRDVKPDNIIVGRDGRARLGDFGLARRGGGDDAAIVGTPAYMAPEVLFGAGGDAASDQFSFGVTAYEVLTGKRPFAGATWSELTASIANARLGVRGPFWLDDAVKRCLAPDPANRFPSMQAAADALSRGLARRPGPILAAAGALMIVVLATTVTRCVARRPSGDDPCRIGDAELAPVWSDQRRDELVAAWHGSPDVVAAIMALDQWSARWTAEREMTCRAAPIEPPATTAAREHCLDQRRAELGAVLARQPGADRLLDALAALPEPGDCNVVDLRADRLPTDPARAKAAEDVQSALPQLRAAIALGDARPVIDRVAALLETARASGHAPTLAEALLVDADALRGVDRFADAAIAARDAVAAAERGHDDLAAARAWIVRVALAGEVRGLASADDLAAIASAAVDRAGAPERLVATLQRLRGTIAYDRGALAEARQLLVDARARFARFSGDRSFDVAAVDSALGSVARAAGDLDEAERRHRASLEVDRLLRGPQHPDVARDLHNLAGVLRLRGSLDAAAATYREALAIEVATAGERSAEAGLTHNSLGLVAMARGDWPTARTELSQALDALTAAGHGDRAFAEHNLGLVAAALGDHREALARYTRAAEIYRTTIGDTAPPAIRLLLDLARSEAATGHRQVARDLATRAGDAARGAEIPWIADDAKSFLASNPAPVVAVEPPPKRPAAPPVAPPPAKPPIEPKRDVGVYGARQP
jgi:eukaryotic-like serine/threonine-protein kinase